LALRAVSGFSQSTSGGNRADNERRIGVPLLQRLPNILLIPGTSSVEHLRENVAGAGLQLPHDAIKELHAIAG
jgi:hypothetical protein